MSTVLLKFMKVFHTQQDRLDCVLSLGTAITYLDVKVVPLVIFKGISKLVSVSNQWSEYSTQENMSPTDKSRAGEHTPWIGHFSNLGCGRQSSKIWMSWAINRPYFQEAESCRYFKIPNSWPAGLCMQLEIVGSWFKHSENRHTHTQFQDKLLWLAFFFAFRRWQFLQSKATLTTDQKEHRLFNQTVQ